MVSKHVQGTHHFQLLPFDKKVRTGFLCCGADWIKSKKPPRHNEDSRDRCYLKTLIDGDVLKLGTDKGSSCRSEFDQSCKLFLAVDGFSSRGGSILSPTTPPSKDLITEIDSPKNAQVLCPNQQPSPRISSNFRSLQSPLLAFLLHLMPLLGEVRGKLGSLKFWKLQLRNSNLR